MSNLSWIVPTRVDGPVVECGANFTNILYMMYRYAYTDKAPIGKHLFFGSIF